MTWEKTINGDFIKGYLVIAKDNYSGGQEILILLQQPSCENVQ